MGLMGLSRAIVFESIPKHETFVLRKIVREPVVFCRVILCNVERSEGSQIVVW